MPTADQQASITAHFKAQKLHTLQFKFKKQIALFKDAFQVQTKNKNAFNLAMRGSTTGNLKLT